MKLKVCLVISKSFLSPILICTFLCLACPQDRSLRFVTEVGLASKPFGFCEDSQVIMRYIMTGAASTPPLFDLIASGAPIQIREQNNSVLLL